MRYLRQMPFEERIKIYNEAMRLHREEGWGNRRIAKAFNISRGAVLSWLRGNIMPSSANNYHRPDLTPSRELSYVLGAYYSDAHINTGTEGYYSIYLYSMDREFVEEFDRCICKVLKKKKRYPVYFSKSKNLYGVSGASKLLVNFLKKPLEEHKPIIESFPSEFLRALFDGDGTVGIYPQYNQYSITLYNTNSELVNYVQELLKEYFGIRSNIYVKKWDGKYKDCYQLYICGKDTDIKKFYEKIGFTITRKQNKFRLINQ